MIKAERIHGFQKLCPLGNQMQLLILFSVMCLQFQRPRALYDLSGVHGKPSPEAGSSTQETTFLKGLPLSFI